MPRWRTMIEPAETSWPSPAFTPNRWPTLSRPFFELDPAFLWAMAYWSFLVRWRFGLAPPAVSSPFESVVLPFAGAVFGAEAFASPADALAVPAFAERGLGDPVFVDPASSALAAPRLARVPVAAFCSAVAPSTAATLRPFHRPFLQPLALCGPQASRRRPRPPLPGEPPPPRASGARSWPPPPPCEHPQQHSCRPTRCR